MRPPSNLTALKPSFGLYSPRSVATEVVSRANVTPAKGPRSGTAANGGRRFEKSTYVSERSASEWKANRTQLMREVSCNLLHSRHKRAISPHSVPGISLVRRVLTNPVEKHHHVLREYPKSRTSPMELHRKAHLLQYEGTARQMLVDAIASEF